MARSIIRLQAYQDAIELADFIARSSLSASIRFAEAFDETCSKLGDVPELGSPWESDFAHHLGLCYWPVVGFPNHLVFFRRIADGIEILRVAHASRDLGTIGDKL
jgi:toxin ParE1/3/4